MSGHHDPAADHPFPPESGPSPAPHHGSELRPRRRRVLSGAALGGAALGLAELAPVPAATAAPAPEERTGRGLSAPVDIARWYEDQYRRFRIPALERTSSGVLLAAFDGRQDMGDLPTPGIGVLLRRSSDEGETWTPLQTIRTHPGWSCGDPSLLVDHETGRSFCFFTSAKNAGYADSGTGNDPRDPDITQQDLAFSDDDGLTWQHRRITAAVKDPAWAGMFASSGAGLQLRHGPHAGRLLQQFVVRIDGENYAVTGYSDDHGASWSHGEPAGPGADENKVSELSDGSVLLNVRARGVRRQAISHDGGAHYDELADVPEQIDPGSNGDVRRLFPEAEPGSALARIQVLVHDADPSIRRNLTLRVSFDDGATWPSAVALSSGSAAYPTMIALGDGRLGLLYEREGYSAISFRRIDVPVLAPSPLVLSVPEDLHLAAGSMHDVTVGLHNTGSHPVNQVRVGITGTDGISSRAVLARTVPAGTRREVTVRVRVPQGIAGPRDLELTSTAHAARTPFGSGGRVQSSRPARISVDRRGPDHPSLSLMPEIDAVYPDTTQDGLIGDRAVPWARVRNSGNVAITDIHVSSDLGGDGATIARLEPGERETVTERTALSRVLTASDVDGGSFAPTITARGDSRAGTVTTRERLSRLDLRTRRSVRAAGAVALPTGDLRTSAFVRGDQDVAASGTLPDGAPLALTLAPGSRTSVQLVVTASEDGAVDLDARGVSDWSASLVQRISLVEEGGAATGERTIDPLTPLPARIVAGDPRSIWATVSVPSDAVAGVHEDALRIRVGGRTVASFPLRLTVLGPRLTALEDRQFTLDLWWHPDAIADRAGLTVFSEEHWQACRPYLKDLASRGQRVVNTVITEDPWLIEDGAKTVPQTASHYASLVEWSWDGDDFTFDFTHFDRCVREHERAGITGPIHLFAMIQFRLDQRLTYTDTRSGKHMVETVELGDARYREGWGAFLTAMHTHLVDRGWWDRAALSFDERPKELMDAVYAVIHDVAPMWDGRTALAANSLAEADIAHVISFNHSFLADVPAETIRDRRAAGEPTLFYTYYSPVRPNTVTASPPMSARMLGWEVARYDLDGYLRWTYNSWPKDVFAHPSHRYGQGDEYIVYPGADGPISSLRWESLRDGVDDAEVLRLLREKDPQLLTDLLADLPADDADRREAWWAMLEGRERALDRLA